MSVALQPAAFARRAVCEGQVLTGGPQSAAYNTETIQAALTAGGFVYLTVPGTYLINDTLIIGSDTYFCGVPGVVLKLAPATNKAMLVNSALDTARSATVTIAWTEGVIATVTWTAHGLDESDYVCFQGAAQTTLNNVFAVDEVIDANSFTIRLRRRGTATGSGTITGFKCDKNFHIEGITFDYDYANNASAAQTYDRHACVIMYAGNFSIRKCIGKNVYKYAFNTAAAADYVIEQVSGYNCAEVLKTYGPCVNGNIRGLYGHARDDFATVQAKEPATFIAYQPAFGDIYGVTFESVQGSSQGPTQSGCVVVYASDNEIISDVVYRNCVLYSENGNGLVIKNGDTFTGTIDSVRIENINSAGKSSTNYPINVGCNVRLLTVDGFTPAANDLTTQLLRQESTSTIDTLSIRGIVFRNTSWSSATAYVINLNGGIGTAEIADCNLALNTSNGRFINLGTGTLGPITLRNNRLSGLSRIMLVAAGGANDRKVNLLNNNITQQSGASGIPTLTKTFFNLNGNAFTDIPNGVIAPQTTAGLMAVISGSGNQFLGTSVAVVCSGSSTADIMSLDFTVDPAATGINATDGNVAKRLATGAIMAANGSAWADLN